MIDKEVVKEMLKDCKESMEVYRGQALEYQEEVEKLERQKQVLEQFLSDY